MRVLVAITVALALHAGPAWAGASPCGGGVVFEDGNGNGVRDPGEPGLAGIRVSDGSRLVATDLQGRYRFPTPAGGHTLFLIKPAGFAVSRRADGLPDYWRNKFPKPGPVLRHGGMPAATDCRDFALARQRLSPHRRANGLRVLVFADPQPKSMADVDYYTRDIIEPLMQASAMPMGDRGPPLYSRGLAGDLGVSLGDIVNDDLSLYPAMNQATARLGVPWLHVAGNHDLDFDAARDEESLLTFRHTFGPDTLAWEEPEAVFVALDDVIYRPGQAPAYIGGLRADQFAFLEAYLPTVPKDRLLVLGMHIPLFEPEGRDTFRDDDRARLFGLLRDFPHVLVLSAHSHTQQHVFHDAQAGWQGAAPLHEYNVGAACGAFWSGAKDPSGIPDSTMADGTPNGYASMMVGKAGAYTLAWHPARSAPGTGMRLHAPNVLRRGAYPAWGVYANVFMGMDDSVVEYRVDGGEWKAMRKSTRPDPWLLAENARDDASAALRGYDRSPEAEPSAHLWRGALPTDLAVGRHRIEVRARDRWRGELRAETDYRLEDASP